MKIYTYINDVENIVGILNCSEQAIQKNSSELSMYNLNRSCIAISGW